MIHPIHRTAAVVVAATLTLGAASLAQHHNMHDRRALATDPRLAQGQIAPLLEGLGENHFPITTRSERAQIFFDQGLKLTYAFHHQEALRAFKRRRGSIRSAPWPTGAGLWCSART